MAWGNYWMASQFPVVDHFPRRDVYQDLAARTSIEILRNLFCICG